MEIILGRERAVLGVCRSNLHSRESAALSLSLRLTLKSSESSSHSLLFLVRTSNKQGPSSQMFIYNSILGLNRLKYIQSIIQSIALSVGATKCVDHALKSIKETSEYKLIVTSNN